MKKLMSMLMILMLLAGFAMAEAEDWTQLLQRAEAGDAAAQVALGDCYYEGNGVEQNYTIAAQWYLKAAEQGSMEGQYKLGMCYYNGYGVAQDMERASYWMLLACEQGEKYGDVMETEEDLAELNLAGEYE